MRLSLGLPGVMTDNIPPNGSVNCGFVVFFDANHKLLIFRDISNVLILRFFQWVTYDTNAEHFIHQFIDKTTLTNQRILTTADWMRTTCLEQLQMHMKEI